MVELEGRFTTKRRRKTEYTHGPGGGLRESRMDCVQLDEQGPFDQTFSVILRVTEWVKNDQEITVAPSDPEFRAGLLRDPEQKTDVQLEVQVSR
jgi:hypothetical protein